MRGRFLAANEKRRGFQAQGEKQAFLSQKKTKIKGWSHCCLYHFVNHMKREHLISRLKQLLNAMDKLEFHAEQNRKQLGEARLLVANIARSVFFSDKSVRRTSVRKPKTAARKRT
jgi:hypothetical protein